MPRPIHCILLIDDDPDDNFIHQLVISESDLCAEVRVRENGPDALRFLTQINQPDYLRPDAIFLDINMPGMNGFEFLEEYQQLPDTLKSNVVVIMLTTSLDSTDVLRARRSSDVIGYRPKPLTTAMLQEIVDQYFV